MSMHTLKLQSLKTYNYSGLESRMTEYVAREVVLRFSHILFASCYLLRLNISLDSPTVSLEDVYVQCTYTYLQH